MCNSVRKKNKKQQQKDPLLFARTLRFIFLALVTLMIGYAYYLQTEGVLFKRIIEVTFSMIHPLIETPLLFIGLLSYVGVFYLGYVIGQKRKSKRKSTPKKA